MVSNISFTIFGERPSVGSSSRRSFGCVINPRAIERSCCCPPDKEPANLFLFVWSIGKILKRFSVLRRHSFLLFKENPPISIFSSTVRLLKTLRPCGTKAIPIFIIGYAVGTDAFKAAGEDYFKDYFKRRVEHNVKVRVIVPDDPDTLRVIARDKEELRESLVVPRDKFYFTTETNIYNNKILIVSWKEKFAVVIESQEITDAQRKVFELAWLGAKQF